MSFHNEQASFLDLSTSKREATRFPRVPERLERIPESVECSKTSLIKQPRLKSNHETPERQPEHTKDHGLQSQIGLPLLKRLTFSTVAIGAGWIWSLSQPDSSFQVKFCSWHYTVLSLGMWPDMSRFRFTPRVMLFKDSCHLRLHLIRANWCSL